MALGDTGVHAILVIGDVARKRGYWTCHLVEQGTDLCAVIGIMGGQRRGDDLAGAGIRAEVEFPPGPARAGTVLLNQLLARATQLQPRAVHQQVHGLGITPSISPAARP